MGTLATVGGFRVKSEETLVPSQSAIGEKSLATHAAMDNWQAVGGFRLVKSEQTLVPSQSAIGEIKMARTVANEGVTD